MSGHEDAPWENSFAGVATFFRRGLEAAAGKDGIGIVGLPFDLGTSNAAGARFGPRGVRVASLSLSGPVWPWGTDPLAAMEVVDCGDVHYPYGDTGSFLTEAEAHATRTVRAGGTVLGVGGDHVVTLPLLRAAARAHGPLALLHFDAHSDTGSLARLTHGSVITHAKAEGLLAPERSLQLGLRTSGSRDRDFRGVSTEDLLVDPAGAPALLRRHLRDVVGDHAVYVTVDIDCLDPAFAPGTGTPVPGGLPTWLLLRLLRELEDVRLVGADVVEVAPDLDPTRVTALVAAQILLTFVAVLAAHRAPRARD